MSGHIYEVMHAGGRISTGLSSTDVRQQVALRLIERTARIREVGRHTWHPVETVPGLEFPAEPDAAAHSPALPLTAPTPPPQRASSPSQAVSSLADDWPKDDITDSATPHTAPPPCATPGGGEYPDEPGSPAALAPDSVHEPHRDPLFEPLLEPLLDPLDEPAYESHYNPTPEPIPEDQPKPLSAVTPTHTGDHMSSQYISVARHSLAILIGGYVAKQALNFSATLVAPGSKAASMMTALTTPVVTVSAAWAGYVLITGALDEYGQGDNAGFMRLLRSLAIAAGVFIALTCLMALASSVMQS